MVWFKVDDGFYSHRKVLSIPRQIRAEALGTWTICGTWCASKRTDGKIPAHMIDELGGSMVGAEALVAARLWRKSRGNYTFNNWAEFQFTRAQLDAKADAERERKAEYRAKKDAESLVNPGVVPVGQTRTDAGTNTVSEPPVPSRPVPNPLTEVDNARPVPETARDREESDDESSPNIDWEGRIRAMRVDFDKVRRILAKRTGALSVRPETLFEGIVRILDRAKKRPGDRTGLIIQSFEDDWAEWQQMIDEEEAA